MRAKAGENRAAQEKPVKNELQTRFKYHLRTANGKIRVPHRTTMMW